MAGAPVRTLGDAAAEVMPTATWVLGTRGKAGLPVRRPCGFRVL